MVVPSNIIIITHYQMFSYFLFNWIFVIRKIVSILPISCLTGQEICALTLSFVNRKAEQRLSNCQVHSVQQSYYTCTTRINYKEKELLKLWIIYRVMLQENDTYIDYN